MTDRNPCTNPQHGDSVTVAGETREVESVTGDRVIYSWPGKVAVRTMYLIAWRGWAAKADAWIAAQVEPA